MIPIFDKTAPYIWAAYGATVFGLVLLTVIILATARQARNQLDKLEAMDKEQSK